MTDRATHDSTDIEEKIASAVEKAVAKQAITARAAQIKRQELQQAYNRLGDENNISATERQIIEAMATAIVNDIIASPIAALDKTPTYDDETVETALELFDPTE